MTPRRLASSVACLSGLLLALGCDGTAAPSPVVDGGPEAGLADGRGADVAPVSALFFPLDAIDFGCVLPDQAFAYPVTLTNRSSVPVMPVVVETGLPKPTVVVLSDACTGLPLAPGEGCMLRLFFQTATPGKVEATLTVNAEPGPPLVLPVRAHVSPMASRIPEDADQSMDFGRVGVGDSKSFTVVLINIGDDLAQAPPVILAKKDGFLIGEDLCSGHSLPALGKCTVVVTFAPRRPGWYTDVVRVGSGEACGPVLPITVVGVSDQ